MDFYQEHHGLFFKNTMDFSSRTPWTSIKTTMDFSSRTLVKFHLEQCRLQFRGCMCLGFYEWAFFLNDFPGIVMNIVIMTVL